MALLPRSKLGRVCLGLYAAACSGMLFFAWQQRDIHDMPEALFALMNLFTFPLGFGAAMLLGLATFALSNVFPEGAYHPFLSVVPVWAALTLAGYLQWFVLIPWAWQRLNAWKSHLTTRSSGP